MMKMMKIMTSLGRAQHVEVGEGRAMGEEAGKGWAESGSKGPSEPDPDVWILS